MLVLSRNIGQNLIINENITISVLGVKGRQVRLGIDAPREVQVHREEIYERIQREKAFPMICMADSCGYEGDAEKIQCPSCGGRLVQR